MTARSKVFEPLIYAELFPARQQSKLLPVKVPRSLKCRGSRAILREMAAQPRRASRRGLSFAIVANVQLHST